MGMEWYGIGLAETFYPAVRRKLEEYKVAPSVVRGWIPDHVCTEL
jgi:hypothetical protein